MIKMVAFINKRRGMNHDEFRRYYESHHRHLISYFVEHITDYRRSYPIKDGNRVAVGFTAGESGDGAPPSFDCMTEIWFPNLDEMAKAFEKIGANQLIFEEDENKFMDRSSIRIVICEEFDECEELGRGERSI